MPERAVMGRGSGGAPAERIENPFAARRGPQNRQEPSPGLDLGLRAMTGYEEEVVERRRNDPNTAALCNEIVARCMVAPGADPRATYERVRALSVAERDLAILTVRRLSFGDLVELEVNCPACGGKSDIDFQLNALPLALGPIQREVAVTLSDGTPVAIRLPTSGDQEDLLDAELETESERRTFLLGRTLVNFGDRAGPFDADFARALPVATRNTLEKAVEAAIPDLDLSMAVTCVACGHTFSAPFDVSSFFFAEMTRRGRRMLEDIHRLATRYHWSEEAILRLPITRRLTYLRFIEADNDRALFVALDATR